MIVKYAYPRILPYICTPEGAVLWEDLDRLADEVRMNIQNIFPGTIVEKAVIYLDLSEGEYVVQGQTGLTVIGWRRLPLPPYIKIYSCEELEEKFFGKRWIQPPKEEEELTKPTWEEPTPPPFDEERRKKAIGLLILGGILLLSRK